MSVECPSLPSSSSFSSSSRACPQGLHLSLCACLHRVAHVWRCAVIACGCAPCALSVATALVGPVVVAGCPARSVRCPRAVHEQAFAVRVDMVAGWTVVYSGDTRPCENLVRLGKVRTAPSVPSTRVRFPPPLTPRSHAQHTQHTQSSPHPHPASPPGCSPTVFPVAVVGFFWCALSLLSGCFQGCDILIHEATFDVDEQDNAIAKVWAAGHVAVGCKRANPTPPPHLLALAFPPSIECLPGCFCAARSCCQWHATAIDAIEVARRMDAKATLLTHFSARYPKLPPVEESVRARTPHTPHPHPHTRTHLHSHLHAHSAGAAQFVCAACLPFGRLRSSACVSPMYGAAGMPHLVIEVPVGCRVCRGFCVRGCLRGADRPRWGSPLTCSPCTRTTATCYQGACCGFRTFTAARRGLLNARVLAVCQRGERIFVALCRGCVVCDRLIPQLVALEEELEGPPHRPHPHPT